MIEFASTVDATRCAMEIQRAMVERSCLVDSIRIFGVQGKHGVAAIGRRQ